MIESFVKSFAIIICGLYTYKKLLNLKSNAKDLIVDIVFSGIISFSVYYINLYLPLLTVPLMVIFSFVLLTLTSKTEPGLSVTATIISFGISFVLFAISGLLAATLYKLVAVNPSERNVRILFLLIALIQLILSCIPFRFKRFKSGMPFLQNKGGSNIGIFISVFLLCIVIILSNKNDADMTFVILIVSIFLLGAFILIWWRAKIKKLYYKKLRIREVQGLRDVVAESELKIKQLEKQNDSLARIIHKDNKLIPAMEFAVRKYLEFSNLGESGESQAMGQRLLEQLKTISSDRSGMIAEYQSTNKTIPLTNVLSIDALMSYMLNKAREINIELELVISGSIKYMVENVICENDLCTILADLIENAIIATKYSENKIVVVTIGIPEGNYEIEVFDSGMPFEADTIANLGIKKTTTHADSGGSGIGLITAFEIIKKYHASFMIEEITDNNSLYSKEISVVFDNQNRFLVKTSRYDEIKAITQREDLLVIKNKDYIKT